MTGQADLFKRPRPQANAVRVAVASAPEPRRDAAYWDAYHAACSELLPPTSRGPNLCAVCEGPIGQLTPAVPVDGAWLHAEPCWRDWWAKRCASAHAMAAAALAESEAA